MHIKDLQDTEVLCRARLSEVVGGDGGVTAALLFSYGVIVGYTNEKCKMDKGKHWYCIKVN